MHFSICACQRHTVWQRCTVNTQGQTKQTFKSWNWFPEIAHRPAKLVLFFISCLLLTPPYLFCALCWVYCTSQPSSHVPFFRKHNICFFWWRLHKSESFISRQHTSSKTPRRILLFLSNHFLSIFWCQDPSWLTSAGYIWVPYRPVFPVFCHDTWLISVLLSVCVDMEDFNSDIQHLAQRSRSVVPTVAVYLINVFVSYFDWGFYACRPQHLMAHLRLLLIHCKRKMVSWGIRDVINPQALVKGATICMNLWPLWNKCQI